MGNTRLGFDIGSSSPKIAVLRGGETRIEELRLPENMVDGTGAIVLPHAFAQFLKQAKRTCPSLGAGRRWRCPPAR